MTDRLVRLTEEPLFGLWSRHGDPLLMDLPHRHNELELNLLERGSIQYLFPGKRAEIQAGRLFLFWAGMPHQLVSKSTDTYIHWMTFPLAWLLRWNLTDTWIQSLLKGLPAINADETASGSDLSMFYRWHADLESGRIDFKEILVLELEARMRRLNLSSAIPEGQAAPAGSKKGASPEGLGAPERIAQYLADNFAQDWSPSEAARRVGLHPNYAMILFQRTFGVSMVTYVTQLRVAMAQKLLATSAMEILDIAYECGFGSASRFYAAFKAVTQVSPHQYRKSLRWGT